MSDEEGKDRLTSEEFVDLIPHLPFGNIIQIEFFSGVWKRLIASVDISKRLYRCTMCSIILSGPKNVLAHITGKKHIANMSKEKLFYHPEYTFSKALLRDTSAKAKINNLTLDSQQKEQTVSRFKKLTNEKEPTLNLVRNKPVSSSIEKTLNPKEKIQTIENLPIQNSSKNTQLDNPKGIEKEPSQKLSKHDVENQIPKGNIETGQKTVAKTNENVIIKLESKTALNDTKTSRCDISVNKKQESIQDKSIDDSKIKGKQMQAKVKEGERSVDQEEESVKLCKTAQKCPGEALKPCLAKEKTLRNDEKILTSSVNQEKSTIVFTLSRTGVEMDRSRTSNLTDTRKTDTGNNESKQQRENTCQDRDENVICFKNSHIECTVEEQIGPTIFKTRTDVGTSTKKKLDPRQQPLAKVNKTKKIDSPKLVKNPLAGKISTSTRLEAKEVNVICIDDNIRENQSGKYDLSENVKKSEPSEKKQSVSSLQNSELNEQSSKVNMSRVRFSHYKNKDKTTENPEFAVKNITDTRHKDEIWGFVGVEYVIKILRPGVSPKYECGLCELVLEGKIMQNHLLGYNHRLKFCEKHFPTAIQQFRQYIQNVSPDEHYKVMIPVLQKLSVAIEEHHGRSLPFDCFHLRYNSERHRVLRDVFARRHASEQQGPTFTHVVDAKQVDEFILRKDSTKLQLNQNKMIFDKIEDGNFKPDKPYEVIHKRSYYAPRSSNQSGITYPSGSTFLDNDKHKRIVDNFIKANNKSSSFEKPFELNQNKGEIDKPSLKRSYSPFGSRSFPHKELNIWTSYCRLVDNKLKGLEEKFRVYRMNPESHPTYKNEWLKFWHQRKSELTALGKDYRTYDYQPDWVPFFNNRINELYDEAFEKLKIETREELSLPMTNAFLCDPRYFVNVKSDIYSPAVKKTKPSSISPVDMQRFVSQRKLDELAKNFNQEQQISQAFVAKQMKTDSNEIEIQDESAPTVVSVLRLLTALEEFLGSMGPKIVELLSKALQVEKAHQGRTHVLLTDENCTLLETAMEKFKGLVIAGILDGPKERALKKAITHVNALLDSTKKFKEKYSACKKTDMERNVVGGSTVEIMANIGTKNTPQDINEKLKQALRSVSNANDLSKVIHLIEEKISAELKAQGRTDVDRAHLEQLAAVCVLLEKKKQTAGKLGNLNVTSFKPIYQQSLSDTLKSIVTEAGFVDKNFTHSNEMITLNVDRKSEGKFSNLYSNNENLIRMGDNSQFGSKAQQRQWPYSELNKQQQQQHQQGIATSSDWSQYSNPTWNSNERPPTYGQNSQWKIYKKNEPQSLFRGQFRYN